MEATNPFLLGRPPGARIQGLAARAAERALGLSALQRVYEGLQGAHSPLAFAERALAALGIELEVDAQDLARVPSEGPTLVVSNHPYGAPEGLALAALLARRRGDVRILANRVLNRIPELRPLLIPVDAFAGAGAQERNGAPLRRALLWLRGGGLLVVFPAGAVSHLHVARRRVSDPPWTRHVAALLRRSEACAVPVFFEGRNSDLFQLAGLLHPLLRTALLPRELLKRSRATLRLRIGRPLSAQTLAAAGDDDRLVEHLRLRTYLLGERLRPVAAPAPELEPLAEPEPPAALAADVAALPADRLLLSSNGIAVYAAHAGELPCVLPEIGRLRERTFRAEGEGTGRARDLDGFDAHYLQLFAWDQKERAILGAYRLVLTQAALSAHGRGGLYTASLFNIQPGFFHRLGPALELGRSFVRAESQRGTATLFLLWRGIARVVLRHPEVRYLFGPVSMSASYHPLSRTLMAEYLRSQRADAELCSLVRSKRPFRGSRLPHHPLIHLDELAATVQDLERGRRVPVLLKEYAKLGARLLELSVDPGFGQALDALVLVDLPAAPERLISRYFGAADFAAYRARHLSPAPVGRAG